jgi:hypothetical protein
MYNGYELEQGSREKLRTLFPPKYPQFLGHHITEKFGVKSDNVPPQPNTVKVVGYIDNGKDVEGFLVEIDGTTDRPDGSKYHITWSIDRGKGAKPFHMKNHINDATPLKRPVEIDVDAKFFDKPTDAYVKTGR